MTPPSNDRFQKQLDEVTARVSKLELLSAIRSESDKHIDARFDTIERIFSTRMDGIEKTQEESANDLKWAKRILIGVVIAAFANWLLEGNLSKRAIEQISPKASVSEAQPKKLTGVVK